MLRDDVLDVLDRITPNDLPKTVLTLRFNSAITMDAVIRQDTDYIIVRGREAGTNDEGRAFFLPYEDILYIKIDRVIKINDVRAMYGEKLLEETGLDFLAKQPAATPNPASTPAPQEAIAPGAATDPATIAKQNLLARIRAARTAAGVTSAPG